MEPGEATAEERAFLKTLGAATRKMGELDREIGELMPADDFVASLAASRVQRGRGAERAPPLRTLPAAGKRRAAAAAAAATLGSPQSGGRDGQARGGSFAPGADAPAPAPAVEAEVEVRSPRPPRHGRREVRPKPEARGGGGPRVGAFAEPATAPPPAVTAALERVLTEEGLAGRGGLAYEQVARSVRDPVKPRHAGATEARKAKHEVLAELDPEGADRRRQIDMLRARMKAGGGGA